LKLLQCDKRYELGPRDELPEYPVVL